MTDPVLNHSYDGRDGPTASQAPRRTKRFVLYVAFAVLAVWAATFIVTPFVSYLIGEAPISPLGFDPPPPPKLEGALEVNEALREAEILFEGEAVTGPEDLAVDAQGRVYGGTQWGSIVRLEQGADGYWQPEIFAKTGGRPLGLHFDADQGLVVADAKRGLLRLDQQGRIVGLSRSAMGRPYRFTDDLDIASDGRIYFSDASTYGIDDYLYDLLEARPHGRLLRYDPSAGSTATLLEGLYFANGVALSQNEDFVLVNETYRYRITRYWLKGPKAGSSDIFADNLPGFADGISRNERGQFWVAYYTVRNPALDFIHPSPMIKGTLSGMPRSWWPKPKPYGLVVEYDEQGNALRSLHDPGGDLITEVTSAQEEDDYLYLGTLKESRMARLKL